MKTGTGKTYVYTKTIFELNRKYGFTKFIVVVSSVAIREGVYKSFQVTEEHFALQYDRVPCRYYSTKLADVRQFAASANINVLQVCTLIEQKSTFTCRQKVGRGLRLCVNQEGERVEDRDINVLHVMTNESFAEFAAILQKEIEDETGVKFGVLNLNLFSGMVYEEKRQEA